MVDCPGHSLKLLLRKAFRVRVWNIIFSAKACKHCYARVSGLSRFFSRIARPEEPFFPVSKALDQVGSIPTNTSKFWRAMEGSNNGSSGSVVETVLADTFCFFYNR